jgi:hypothetical protein
VQEGFFPDLKGWGGHGALLFTVSLSVIWWVLLIIISFDYLSLSLLSCPNPLASESYFTTKMHENSHLQIDTRNTRVKHACDELHNLTRVLKYTCQVCHVYWNTRVKLDTCILIFNTRIKTIWHEYWNTRVKFDTCILILVSNCFDTCITIHVAKCFFKKKKNPNSVFYLNKI